MDLPIFYDEAEEWSKAILLYDAALKEINTKLEILNNEFKLTHQYNPIEHITSRVKSPESIAKKIRRDGHELTVHNIVKYINDVAGIRIICSFTSDIYRIASAITNQSDIKVLKIKDYIKNPKPNGYMSYHMIVSIPIFLSETMVDTKVEIQIRTIAMDFWASLEHKIYYKFEGNAPENIRRDLKECADLVAYLDRKMLLINEDIKKFSKEQEDHYKFFFSDEIQESCGTIIDDESIETVEEAAEGEDDAQVKAADSDMMLKQLIAREEEIHENMSVTEDNSTDSIGFMKKIGFGRKEKKDKKDKKTETVKAPYRSEFQQMS